jgi:CBS domain-containing protein
VRLFTGDAVAMVDQEATLQRAAQTLVADEVGLLVVGTADEVAGVVSERDLVRAMALGRDPGATLVSEVASTRLVWCDVTGDRG